ncbi:ABC transporter permease [Gemmobacter fulvus]|uniref:ABC transporter permease n=1 Tax=Gemmobacter fulvus TaxID=2840474 RepID=A0A975S1J0_9RHOB|nr:ABC transporter permease [Gemmobacter fulvus]MBT9244964.1 ABC transporter permease [Gemmobacter fulvus]QWK90682.1 ABC transporter permease [Gemmobacter fulvus]
MKTPDFRLWGLAPAWIIMAFTLILPIAIVLMVSFATRGAYGGFEWGFSPASYTQILFEEGWEGETEFTAQYLWIIGRTLWLAGLTTLICAALALPAAYTIAQAGPRLRAVLIYLVTLPFWVSMIVRVYAWIIILGNDGVIEKTLRGLGLLADIDSLLFTNGAMLTGLVYSYIPLMILPVFASVEKLDPALIEASHDLYGSRWVTARRVILPLAMPGLMAGAILVFVPCLGAVLEPILLGGGKAMLMGNLIQTQFGGGRNWPFGAAIAILLMGLVMIFLMLNALRAQREVAHGA